MQTSKARQPMAQTFFQEPHEDTFLPTGYFSFYKALNLLGRSQFGKQWEGELEFRYRNFECVSEAVETETKKTKYRPEVVKYVPPAPKTIQQWQTDVARDLIAEANEPATKHLLADSDALRGAMAAVKLDAERPLVDASNRYSALIDKVRQALVDETLVAVGVSNDGIEVTLQDTHWRGSLAITVLYEGKCRIDGPSFARKSNQLLFVRFKKTSLNGFISGQIEAPKRTKTEENALAYKWIYALIERSRHKKERSTEEYRLMFNSDQNAKVSRDRWYVQWKKCVEELDAYDPWSRPGTREK
ncbi:hypothetical protein [Ascidiaceihabitans sp.]|uniref:hypothetical protein n=1 Tax=Ascidiaceihabitans sp. TaxID=1872644 RepID=UPI0032974FF6